MGKKSMKIIKKSLKLNPKSNKSKKHRKLIKVNLPKMRKRFLFNGDSNNQIKGVGILFTRIDENGETQLLVQETGKHKKKKYSEKISDFGGKVDDTDSSPIFTASRELHEESNGALYRKESKKAKNEDEQISRHIDDVQTKKYLDINELKKIVQNHKYKVIYSSNSKYLLYLVNFPSTINVDFTKAGAYEQLDKIKRDVKWISVTEFNSNYKTKKNHYRLFNNDLMTYLQSLSNTNANANTNNNTNNNEQ